LYDRINAAKRGERIPVNPSGSETLRACLIILTGFYLEEGFAGIDHVARGGADFLHRAVAGGFELVLHFHSFDHGQRLVLADLVSLGHVELVQADLLLCPTCGGAMKVVAFLSDLTVVP
jgi:hypothetical protein